MNATSKAADNIHHTAQLLACKQEDFLLQTFESSLYAHKHRIRGDLWTNIASEEICGVIAADCSPARRLKRRQKEYTRHILFA